MSTPINDYNNPFFDHTQPKTPLGQRVLRFSEISVAAVFVLIIAYLFIFTPHQVKGISMEPNYHTDQLLIVNRLNSLLAGTGLESVLGLNFQHGDVIVFHKPDMEESLVKRIIGLPGDTVGIRKGNFYVNGKLLKEEYVKAGITNPGDFLGEGDSVKVPPGYVFASGDNRPNSLDSRSNIVGMVDQRWITGKVVLRFWPLSDFSFIGTGVQSTD